jgi:hypothetical protein
MLDMSIYHVLRADDPKRDLPYREAMPFLRECQLSLVAEHQPQMSQAIRSVAEKYRPVTWP